MHLQARCNMHHPGFHKAMIKIYVSSMLMSWNLKIHKSAFFFFHLFFQFERVYFYMLYFAATEAQELPLSTFLKRINLIRKIRLISKFLTTQPSKQRFTTNLLLNISRIIGNQTMKFGQLIQHSKRNIFL